MGGRMGVVIEVHEDDGLEGKRCVYYGFRSYRQCMGWDRAGVGAYTDGHKH
jgi:hypothetical protein